MRYTEKTSIENVRAWLAERRVVTSRQGFQFFIKRLLNLMTDEQARGLGIDLPLLHAVRRRLKLPTTPVVGRPTTVRPLARFNARSRRRRVLAAKEVKRPSARPPSTASHQEPLASKPTSSARRSDPASIEALYAKLKGTPEKPDGYFDYKIVNKVARAKLSRASRQVYPNYNGTTIHIFTEHEYTEQELVDEFGLSPAEAASCFMSFDD